MFNIISIHIIHRIHNQFFLRIMLSIDIITCKIKTQNDMKSHTGYTQSNFVNSLLSLNAWIANMLSVGIHITESHKVKNIHNIMRALARDVNNISIRTFLFSFLLILEKNITKHSRVDKRIHTK
jgi:hypothetical protein